MIQLLKTLDFRCFGCYSINMNNTDIFDVVKPKLKLFGERAARVTTAEMNLVFEEIKHIFADSEYIRRMELVKALPSKEDHGDIDIVVETLPGMDLKEYIRSNLVYDYLYLLEVVHNGPILHCLFASRRINKTVHVDFIFASTDEYNSTLMYLSYNDFSGILGVFTRKLKFNYSNKGFYKIYVDKKGQYHYILLSNDLFDGLKMLGFEDIISKYNNIQNNEDITAFIGYSDLFDSSYLSNNDLNRGDRKRMRAGRATARDLKAKLLALNKNRTQMDDDYYLRNLFPAVYSQYLERCKAIEDYVPPKSKYNGHWILHNFPSLKPGPIIGKIQQYWMVLYGEKIDDVEEHEMIEKTKMFLNM